MKRRLVECKCCGTYGKHIGHGYINACYTRWVRAGRPEDGPPPAGHRGRGREAAERLEDFVMVLKTRPDATIAQLAEAVGRCQRTGERYMATLREQGAIQ